jgi:hypothetical protein
MTSTTLSSSPALSTTRHRQAADAASARGAAAPLVVDGRVWFYDMPMNPQLREKGYLPAKGLLEPTLARVVHKTLLLQQWRRECSRDNHIPTAASVSNTALTDALLLELRPRIEAIAACRLVPTYSYARVYFHGDAMVRHQDRESCEVSVSIHLGRDGGDASLWFQPGAKVEMEPGDGAVYLYETDHWREGFTGNTMGQIFLHYVVTDGRFAAHYFDGRPQRFPPSIMNGLR